RDLLHVARGIVEQLLVAGRVSHPHVEDDLGDALHLHRRLVPELLRERGDDFLVVDFLQAGHGSLSLRVDLLAVRLVEAHLAAILEDADTDAVGLLRHRIPQRDIRDVERHVLVDDAALLALHRVGALILLHLIHAADDDVRGRYFGNLASLAFVSSGDDDDVVALLDLAHGFSPALSAYSTSGASETIFMNRSVRSSRVTGPKMRVPIGSSLGVSSTAALASKRTRAPSSRRTPWRVRTTTAL